MTENVAGGNKIQQRHYTLQGVMRALEQKTWQLRSSKCSSGHLLVQLLFLLL